LYFELVVLLEDFQNREQTFPIQVYQCHEYGSEVGIAQFHP
jgi:hypothetical protein